MQLLRPLALATGTLTVLRLPVPGEVEAEELQRSTALYPLVGLGVGAVPALVLLLPLPPIPRAALALTLWVLVTGGFHLDGWADCADAAFAPKTGDLAATRARRLEILRDPRVGTFGVAGIGLLLLCKWSALVHSSAIAPLLAVPVARWSMVWALAVIPPARRDGLAAVLAGRVRAGWATAVLGVVVAGVIASGVAFGRMALGGMMLGRMASVVPKSGLEVLGTTSSEAAFVVAAVSAVGVGILGGALLASFLARRFGGVTGDLCGAVGEGVEVLVIWALLVLGVG